MDVTPSIPSTTASVTAFDVLEVKDELHLAVSIKFTSHGSNTETYQVFWATIQRPKLKLMLQLNFKDSQQQVCCA